MNKTFFKKKSLIISCCITALVLCIILLCVSCSSGYYVKIDSQVGAHYLMFKAIVDNHADISIFSNLSFDMSSTTLTDEENAELSKLIKEYCDQKKVNYLEMSKSELRESDRIVSGIYGDEFEDGYLLTYSLTGWTEDDEGEIYTGDIMLWHNGFDAVGCFGFRIRKNSKGWYIDSSKEHPGYGLMVS